MNWELDVRPRRSVRIAIVVAVMLLAFFVFGGIVLRHGSTGVQFRTADQAAMIGIGVLCAGAALLFTRPRLRAGADGVLVRNILGDRRFEWSQIRGLSFPDGKPWPRLELPGDEYVPVLAIRAADRDHAVDAVRRFRALGAKYAAS
ncbi:PH domain-containing protein [Skermania piniformis]|uniref:PH domain-containing protein n=1 Tax=Skermania pinensis TaxID=39122 RepID=A0ABX8SC64_9ACTN|nr:PH domain-containing protein [Skermania piniformis]QXQ15483.1 PH domain-containing protein [Skermania piniformis]